MYRILCIRNPALGFAVVESSEPDMDADNCTSTGRACREGFYCDSGVCLPRCDEWEQYPHATVVAVDVIVILSAATGLIAGIAVLVFSCISWKQR